MAESMSNDIIELLERLPTDNITVKMLYALKRIVPVDWENLTGAEQSIMTITGETNPSRVAAIGDRCREIYNDNSNGYQDAVWLYQTIDKIDVAIGTAALANKVGEKIGILSFLNNLIPKADQLQAVDLCLKLVVELIAYSKMKRLSLLSPQEFVTELRAHYTGAAMMRMAALICLDGLLPLGLDFVQKVTSFLNREGRQAIEASPAFETVAGMIPSSDKFGLIKNTFDTVSDWMSNFVSSTGVTPQSISSQIGNIVELADDSFDLVAAFVDQSTNFFAHTGIQSVARQVILQANEDVPHSGFEQKVSSQNDDYLNSSNTKKESGYESNKEYLKREKELEREERKREKKQAKEERKREKKQAKKERKQEKKQAKKERKRTR
ncbi:hypothetical protein [Pleurocapsa sp. PCC 7319]|uniref:hypothetical protein n=1 Tax=Pleurocapsa sp. PCC 7319 TaxID=118161 RepID=UPI00034D9B7F|nr:hypothetical protein [Pleurocapsa sp. PCC 7319]